MCGAVRYEVAVIFDSDWCHCRMCLRQHGAPLPWYNTRPEHFSIVEGEPTSWRSSEHGTRTFCGRCGTPICWRPDDPTGYVSAPIGTLDEPDDISPQIHQWWSSRVSWGPDDGGLLTVEDGRLPHPNDR